MYCRNCGRPLVPGSNVCTSCGAPVGYGNQFCSNCGAPTDPYATFCTNCGFRFAAYGVPLGYQQKSKLAAGLLGIFLGVFGVHNFYLGYTSKAVVQLVLGICCLSFVSAIWGFIEGILILCGNINVDGNGVPLKE